MRYFILILLLLFIPVGSEAKSGICTIAEDSRADDAISRIKDWDSLYNVYSQFKNCDNGGTAELFDDAVIKILANNWSTTQRLVTLMSSDKDFGKFVISHISATGDLNELKRIQINAKSNCIPGSKSTCVLIESKAASAIKTLESFGIH